MPRAPYAPGDAVSIAYEPDAVSGPPWRYRPPLWLRSNVPVTSVCPMAHGWFRIEFRDIPGRTGVSYTVDADGAPLDEADVFGRLGHLAPDGRPWIMPEAAHR